MASHPEKTYCVYIMANEPRGILYVGMTSDLLGRTTEHRERLLDGFTKRYGVTMLVGEDTRAAVPDVVFRELDRVRVKGKDEPVTIYEPVGMQGEVPKEKLDRMKLFHQALKFYRAQDWDKAELQLLNLQRADAKDGLYSAFLDRVAYLRSHPPGPAWDGVFDFDTK